MEKPKSEVRPEVEVFEWEEEDIEGMETQDALEKFIEVELTSLAKRAEGILDLGQKTMEDGLAGVGAEIDESDKDYQAVRRWVERIENIPREVRNRAKEISAERRETGWVERRVGFGNFELVLSVHGDLKPGHPLKIHFEDKEGNKVLDARDLLPGGVQLKVGKVALYSEERDEIQLGISEETVGDLPKEIFTLLHEAGHAWQHRDVPHLAAKREALQRGASSEEREKFFVQQGSLEVIEEERDAWQRALQFVSAVRQARGVDLLSPYGNWEEAKEMMLVCFGTHEHAYLANQGDEELKDLFQKILGTRGKDLEVFEVEVRREAENIMAEIKTALKNLYEDFLKKRETKPSLRLEWEDLKKIIVQARGYPANITWILGRDLDEKIFNTGMSETVGKYIDSLKSNKGITWRALLRVLDRKMGKAMAGLSVGLAKKWAKT